MIEVTGVAQRQAWIDRTFPPVEEVRPGLWSIPVPIPNSPLRYVLVYALELRDGVALVDTGWSSDDAWTALIRGLARAGFGVGDVRGVLITHLHPDHYGLASRLREASGAWIALHPADAALLRALYGDRAAGLSARTRALLADCGMPADVIDEIDEESLAVRRCVGLVEPDILLEDGDRAELPGWDLRAVWTPGHSPGHLCFHETSRRLFFAGDHVLPRISPNVSIRPMQGADPLADFLGSLLKVRALDADEVLPAHEYRFRGLGARSDALAAHHEERLSEIERILRGSGAVTCWELAARLSWSRPWSEIRGYMQRAAVGETLAHLVLLEKRGLAVRRGTAPTRWLAGGGSGGSTPAPG